jgi:hypothetical protein
MSAKLTNIGLLQTRGHVTTKANPCSGAPPKQKGTSYFKVPYTRKDEAKGLGARWYPAPMRLWGTDNAAVAERMAEFFEPANVLSVTPSHSVLSSEKSSEESVWYFEVLYAQKDKAKDLGARWYPKPIQHWGTTDPIVASRLEKVFRAAHLGAGGTPSPPGMPQQ